MEQSLLNNMLFATSFVMYAYGLFSFVTISPQGDEYRSYRVSRKLFGSFMIVVASCLLLHWNLGLREKDPLLASSLCLLYTTAGTMILSVIFTSLVQGEYPFSRRLTEIALYNICLAAVLAANYFFIPSSAQYLTLIASALLFIVLTIILIRQFFKRYRQTIKRADNYYSDNVGKNFAWIPITINSIILLVLITAVLSIVADISFISLDLFLGLLIITYIFISLQNYMINISKMKVLLLTDEPKSPEPDNTEQVEKQTVEVKSRESRAVKLKLDKWIESKGFTRQGLTLDDLALELGTNRTYLSSYINTIYNLSFRVWIASQRIEYSKELLLNDDELSAATIAVMIGYSPNAFIKIFTKAQGVPPVQWRNENRARS